MFEGIFQPMHLLIILVVLLLLFGPRKLPELGKGLGEGIRGFKDAMRGGDQKPAAGNPASNSENTAPNVEVKK